MKASMALGFVVLFVWVLPLLVIHLSVQYFLTELTNGQQTILSLAAIFLMNIIVKGFIRKRWGDDFVPHI